MDLTPEIRTRYRAYLLTDAWRSRRNRALKAAFFRCQKCSSKRGLEVHHRTYERLGAERDEDLEVLCRDCHEGHHIEEMQGHEQFRVYLKLADTVQRANVFGSISELAGAVRDECARLKMPYDAHQVDRALHMICGANRFRSAPEPKAEPFFQPYGRALDAHESRELLHRLKLDGLIKTIKPAAPSTIDIYGAVPREDFGDHDRY
jgi:hypothetical protein